MDGLEGRKAVKFIVRVLQPGIMPIEAFLLLFLFLRAHWDLPLDFWTKMDSKRSVKGFKVLGSRLR